ncbi:MAG: hypothetical protein JMDDDDMK_03267 [Acidobacteria bacterium]|nr:hypothetical protein [Acidobacteriota bacterium]
MNSFGFNVEKLEFAGAGNRLAQHNDCVGPDLTSLFPEFGHGLFIYRLTSLRDLITTNIDVYSGHDLVSLFRFAIAKYLHLTIRRPGGALGSDEFYLASDARELPEGWKNQSE